VAEAHAIKRWFSNSPYTTNDNMKKRLYFIDTLKEKMNMPGMVTELAQLNTRYNRTNNDLSSIKGILDKVH